MLYLTVDFDVSDVVRAWGEAIEVIGRGVQRGVEKGVAEGAEHARTHHAYTDRTGKLTRSIKSRVETSTRGGAVGEMSATAPYASYVEGGTAPHTIRPKKKKALRWVDASGVHFARIVRHPGTRPYAFMGPALLKCERVVLREIEIAVAAAQVIMERD